MKTPPYPPIWRAIALRDWWLDPREPRHPCFRIDLPDDVLVRRYGERLGYALLHCKYTEWNADAE